MGIFRKKNGEPTKFSGVLANKDGKPSTFSKILNTTLDVVEFVPIVGTVAKGVGIGVKAGTKQAIKSASKIAVKEASKKALKSAGKLATGSGTKLVIDHAMDRALSVVVEDDLGKPSSSLGSAYSRSKEPTGQSAKYAIIGVGLVSVLWYLIKRK